MYVCAVQGSVCMFVLCRGQYVCLCCAGVSMYVCAIQGVSMYVCAVQGSVCMFVLCRGQYVCLCCAGVSMYVCAVQGSVCMFVLCRGQYGVVHDCLHKTTQQTYTAKLLPLEVGRDHAQHELEILSVLDHPNIIQMTSSYLTPHGFILVFQK